MLNGDSTNTRGQAGRRIICEPDNEKTLSDDVRAELEEMSTYNDVSRSKRISCQCSQTVQSCIRGNTKGLRKSQTSKSSASPRTSSLSHGQTQIVRAVRYASVVMQYTAKVFKTGWGMVGTLTWLDSCFLVWPLSQPLYSVLFIIQRVEHPAAFYVRGPHALPMMVAMSFAC